VYHCARNYLTFAANSIPVGGGDAKDSEPAILYSRLSGLIVLQLFCSGESRMPESRNQERTAEFPNASRGRYQQIPTRVGVLSFHMLS
jgi:hypothetical protein